MTAYVSKEELGLMLPGTMYHYFTDEPEYVVRSPGRAKPGLAARVRAWLSAKVLRRSEAEELASLSDAQLADIGLTRAGVRRAFDPEFVVEYNRQRANLLRTGQGGVL